MCKFGCGSSLTLRVMLPRQNTRWLLILLKGKKGKVPEMAEKARTSLDSISSGLALYLGGDSESSCAWGACWQFGKIVETKVSLGTLLKCRQDTYLWALWPSSFWENQRILRRKQGNSGALGIKNRKTKHGCYCYSM